MRRCEDMTMYNRPPLLEEPFPQTLSGTSALCFGAKHIWKSRCSSHQKLGPFLDIQMWGCVGVAVDSAPLQEELLVRVFCSILQNDGRREEHLQRRMSYGRRSTRDISIRDVRRSGSRFPERGCILEHQIFKFGKIIFHDRCNTSYDLASLFHGRRTTVER